MPDTPPDTPPGTPPDTTALAIDRTILANERTFQAWIRTGLSALATGFGVARFLNETMPLWMYLGISSGLVLLSAGAFWLAGWRYGHLHGRLKAPDLDMTPLWAVRTASTVLMAVALLGLIGIILDGLG
ncbi:MAG TPA: DUF202 domain-containing protein [Aliiroseovarius sp.]|nr:DUF202 domain-containing protein [Aliiroseovarius sp.]